MHIREDCRPVCGIVDRKTVDQCRKRAWRFNALPNILADVVEAEIPALLDAHHDDLAIDLAD